MVIMVVGVVTAKVMGHNPSMIVSVLGDAVGYGLHGIGLIPFVDELMAFVRSTED